MELVWEVAGWAGAVAILGAYLAVSMGWLKTGRAFQSANLVGACAFIINSAFHGAWPSVATNVAWFLISAVALFRMRADYGAASGEAPPVQLPGVPRPGGLALVPQPPFATNGTAEIWAHFQRGWDNRRLSGRRPRIEGRG